MADVLPAVVRIQTRALILAHLAQQVTAQFGVGDAGAPKLLLRLPGGGPFPADAKHVVDIATDLRQLASIERGKLARLLASHVSAAPVDVDAPAVARGPEVAARPGEEVVETAAAKTPAPSKRRAAVGD